MARLKKCTEKDISILLETDSDNDIEESTECYTPEKHINENSSDTSNSDSDKRLDSNKSLLLRKNALQKEQVSLRLRLRRSTEQSSYKIDSDSDNEKPRRTTRNTKHHLKRLQDENQIPHTRARIIRLPKKYSEYDCSSNIKTSVLQKRQISYETKKSFLISSNNDEKEKESRKHEIKYNNYKDNDSESDCVCVFNTRSTRSNVKSKNDKIYHIASIENNDNDTLHKIRTRSSKRISTNTESKRDNANKVPLNEKIVINSKRSITEHNSPHRTPSKRPSKIEHNSLDTTPKRRLATIEHDSLDNIPKRQLKNKKNICRSFLSISDKYKHKTEIHKPEDEEKIDEMAVICENTQNMSLIAKQRKRDAKNVIVSTIVQNGSNTPKSRTPLKHNTLTPSVKMRSDILAKPVTPLQKARSRLHVSAVPKSLPCREEEFNDIYKFLEDKLMDNRGG